VLTPADLRTLNGYYTHYLRLASVTYRARRDEAMRYWLRVAMYELGFDPDADDPLEPVSGDPSDAA